MLAMLNANNDRFAISMEDLEPTKFPRELMRLDLNSDKPIFWPPHKLGQVEMDFVEAQCATLEGLGFIVRSTQSLYASATMVARKKDECGNQATSGSVGNTAPSIRRPPTTGTPSLELRHLQLDGGRGTIFTIKRDLRSGYHQMPLHPEDRKKTTYWGALYPERRRPRKFGRTTQYYRLFRLTNLGVDLAPRSAIRSIDEPGDTTRWATTSSS